MLNFLASEFHEAKTTTALFMAPAFDHVAP
jgi:hypothetical protein